MTEVSSEDRGGRRDHVGVAAAYAGDDRSEPLEVEVADRLAGCGAVGDEHAPEVERAAVEGEMLTGGLADVGDERQDVLFGADDRQQVSGHGHELVGCNLHVAVVLEAAEADRRALVSS